MNMEMEYWPRHKVFFIGTLSLLPKYLRDKAIVEMFYKPYFARDHVDVIEATLQDYQKDGYLKYEESGEFGWQITEVNTQKAVDNLTGYLEKWQRNELLSPRASKPPDAAHQQALLFNAIARAYANHQKEPRITLQDVYGKPSGYDYEPPFWELVLACQLLDMNVEIKHMEYDKRASGIYNDNAQPFVDFRIVSKKFEKAVARALPTTLPANKTTGTIAAEPSRITIRSYVAETGTLFFNGEAIQIILQKNKRGKHVGETAQGRAMRLLFKDVNTLHKGVPLRRIVSVSPANFGTEKRKLAKNHLSEINNKVKEKTGVSDLINYDQTKYYIAKQYLL